MNEKTLTKEHMKAPKELRRRIGQSITVLQSDEDLFVYKNNLSGVVHTYFNGLNGWTYKK